MQIAVEHGHYISIPIDQFISALLSTIEDENTRKEFSDFCRIIEAVYHFEHHELAKELNQDFRALNSSDKKTVDNDINSSARSDALENRFLGNFIELMNKANFCPLTQKDIDVADSEEYLFNLPIQIDWDKFDDRMLSRYFSQQTGISSKDVPDFFDRILVYRRGVDIDRFEGFLTLQKLDTLVSRVLINSLGLILAFNQKIRAGWKILTGQPAEPVSMANSDSKNGIDASDNGHSSHMHAKRLVNRISLKHVGVSFISLFQRTAIQEPTFAQVVILYRTLVADEETTSAIQIKAFRDIPMADLEVVFPEKRISMKPLDLVKLAVTGVVGLGIGLAKMILAAALNPVVALVAIGTILGYAAKIVFGFKASRDRYQYVVTESLYNKNLDNDLGVIFYLVESLEEQEFKEVVLSYYCLWKYGNMNECDLDRCCEEVLNRLFDEEVDFEVDDALKKLTHDHLLLHSNGQFSVPPLGEALRILDSKWDNYFQYSGFVER